MQEEIIIHIHISKEASPLDKPPFRAYFQWLNKGQLVKSEDFSKQELEAEIASGQREGRELELFKEALNRLALSASSNTRN